MVVFFNYVPKLLKLEKSPTIYYYGFKTTLIDCTLIRGFIGRRKRHIEFEFERSHELS